MRLPAAVAIGLVASTLLAAAGCTEPLPAPAPTLPAPVEEAPFAFGSALKVATKPNGQVEAFIDVSPDGQTILTCLHGEFAAASPMFVSRDAGSTFSQIPAMPDWGTGGDCEVAMGDDGWWHFLISTVATETVVSTGDNGTTWTANHVTALPTNGMGDRPWLEAVGNDLILTYMPLSGVTPGQPGSIGVVRSTDHGRTWSTPQTLGGLEADTLIVEGHPLVGPGDLVRIPLMRYERDFDNNGSPCRLFFAVSADHGATWTEEPVAEPTCRPGFASFPTSVAVAGDGTLYWAYFVPASGRTDLVAIVGNGTGWSEPVTLMEGLSSYDIPWMDGRPDGTATLAFVANTTASPRGGQLTMLRLDARLPGLVDATATAGHNTGVEFLAVEHDMHGRAHVVATNGNALEFVREVLAGDAQGPAGEHMHG